MRIAVIGAGIGGLTAAAGLVADGHEAVVYERRDEPGAVGAGLTLFGNALGALDAIGLGDTVRRVSSDAIARMRAGQRVPSGDWLVSMPSAMAPTLRSLHRAELHRVLVEAVPAGILRLGQNVTVAEDGHPVVTVGGGRCIAGRIGWRISSARVPVSRPAPRSRRNSRRCWGQSLAPSRLS